MRKRIYFLMLILFLVPFLGKAALDVKSVKSYGGSGDDLFNDVIATLDGFVAVGGAKGGDFASRGGEDAVIVKFDKDGNEVWKSSFGGNAGDRFNAVIESNGYIAVGVTKSNDAGFGNLSYWSPLAVKFDVNGKVLWSKVYQQKFDSVYAGINVSSKGFVISGRKSTSDKNSCTNAMITVIDNEGNEKQRALYGGNGAFFARTIDTGDGFVSFGATTKEGCEGAGLEVKGSKDFLIAKFDNNLKLQWAKTYGGTLTDQIYDGIKVADGYLVSGYTESKDFEGIANTKQAAILMKLDNNGNKLWVKTLGGTGLNTFDGLMIADEHIVVTGSAEDLGAFTKSKGSTDGIIFKYDLKGELKEQFSFGGSGSDEIFKLARNGQTYAVVGLTTSNDLKVVTNKGGRDAVIFFLGEALNKNLITIASNKNVEIKIKEDIAKIKPGDLVNLIVKARRGQKIKKLFYRVKESGIEVEITGNKFELPNHEIVIDALVEKNILEKETKKKKSSGLIIFLVILILVVMLFGGYFLWKLFKAHKSDNNDEISPEKVDTPDDEGFNYYI